MRFLAAGAAIQGAVMTCPAAISDHLPTWVMSTASSVAFAFLVLSGFGRVTSVEKPDVQSSKSCQ